MFCEISLKQSEKNPHRFLLADLSSVVRDYRMKRLIFGVISSPFLATRVLHQMAWDYKEDFTKAARLILEAFYVDDSLTVADRQKQNKQLLHHYA